MTKLLTAYRRARYKYKNADQSDWPWIAQGLLRHIKEETLDRLGLKPTDRREFAKGNPVAKVKILGPYLEAAAKVEERAKMESKVGRLGEAIGAFKKSAKTRTQGIRFSPEKLYAMVRASSAKSLAFQLGGKTCLYFPLPLIRRIMADLKGLKSVTVDLMRKDNMFCLSYLNETGGRGNMRLVAHGVAEDPQKVLSLDMRPWLRPARVVSSSAVRKQVAVLAMPVHVSPPLKPGFMKRLAGWFEEFAQDLS